MSIINLSALICLSFSGLWLVSVFLEFSVIVCSYTKKLNTVLENIPFDFSRDNL